MARFYPGKILETNNLLAKYSRIRTWKAFAKVAVRVMNRRLGSRVNLWRSEIRAHGSIVRVLNSTVKVVRHKASIFAVENFEACRSATAIQEIRLNDRRLRRVIAFKLSRPGDPLPAIAAGKSERG
jgi:hypothetical protein